MKNYLRFLSPVMLLIMAVMFGGGKILAQTANLTFTKACDGKGTDNKNGAWDISSDADESSFDSNRGIHYGTNKKDEVSYITATTKAYSTKTITKIVVNASAADAGSPKVSCTVGGASFGTEQALTNTNTPYTFEGTATGDIVVKVSKNKTKKALYLKSIEVTYKEDDGKTQTTLSFGETYDGKTINAYLGDEFTAPTATLTPNIEGETIKYSSSKPTVATVDETTGAVTIVGAGTTVITADFVGDDTYAASKASYTINVIKVITSIAELKKQGLDDKTEKTFTLKLTDAVVSYVHGANAYMEDASAGILVYLEGKQTLVAGQKFNGLVEVKAQTYNSLPEITSWAPTASMTTETVTELPLQVVTVEELINNYDKYEGRRVKVLGATVSKAFSNKNGEITQNGLSITLRAGATNIKATRYDIVNVIGFPSVYETKDTRTIQLAIWEKSAIEVINTETLTTSAKGYATYSADYAVNYSKLGLTAYTLTVDETNKTVTAKAFTGVVPAGGAVLVKGDASKAYTLTPATTEGDATFATDLKTGATKADGTQYGFTSKSGTPAFAQVVSGQDIPSKKGYIVLNGASAAKYSICFGDEATGIHTIEAASAANATMYNLAGQRVDKAYKGIVIVNGKKYLNK